MQQPIAAGDMAINQVLKLLARQVLRKPYKPGATVLQKAERSCCPITIN